MVDIFIHLSDSNVNTPSLLVDYPVIIDFSLVIMDSQQLIGILLIVIINMNKAIAVSREACKGQQNALWDINVQRCTNCLHCPPGRGYTGVLPCGNGVEGEKGECRPCEEGQFQSEKHSQLQCAPCKKCVNRVVIRNCSHEFLDSHDAICGDCLPGYASLTENSTCESCHGLRGQTIPGCQVDQITTDMETLTSSDMTTPSNYDSQTVEDLPTSEAAADGLTTPWIFVLALAIVVAVLIIGVIIFVFYRTWKKQQWLRAAGKSSCANGLDGGESGDLNTTVETPVRAPTDGSPDVTQIRETTPFIAANIENEANPSPASSGYISHDENEKFPRDTRLRRRYEKALEISKDERYNRRVSECNLDVLQKLSIELNPPCTFGTKNWRHLGCYLNVPNRILKNYENLKDPLDNVLKYADTLQALKLDAFLPEVKRVENHEALNVIVGYVIGLTAEEMNSQDKELNNEIDELEKTC